MKKIVYKSRAIQAVILIVAACLLMSFWPLRLWKEQVVTSVPFETGTVTEPIDEERTVLQSIVAQYDHMDTISVYLGEECTGESFYLRILDEQWQQVCEEKTAINPAALPGYQEVLIDVPMEVGKLYYIILQGKDSQITAGYEAVPLSDMPYLGTMYYAESTMEGMSLAAEYRYGVPLRKGKVLLFGGLIALLAAVLILAVRMYYKKKEDKLITVEKVFRCTMNPLAAFGTLLCLGAVVTGFFGSYLLDNTVYFISVLLLSGILFYGINHNRNGQEPILTWEYVKSHFGDLVQSVCLAGAVAACCEYMSGLYDIHHAVAERKEMLWFALAVIAMFKWKEIINLYNVIYLAGAGACGYYYYQKHLTEEMDELAVQVLKLTVWVAVLLGLILIRTVKGLLQGRLKRPDILYAGLLGLFFVGIIYFRNGRWWGVAMVTAFTLFYLNYGMWEHKERLLVNVARGIILQFMAATGYCLLHRPYVTYRNARYTHIFHTVTITASYLTIVVCAAMVILLAKYAKTRKLKDVWKELVLFGVVSSYMVFTMARTGFFAVGVTVLFTLLFMAAGKGWERLKNAGKNLGMMALALFICLPITFTAQRNIPALVSDPFLYEIEYYLYCPEDVMRGRNVNSVNFMRVGRFIDVFADKIFGIPDGTFDIYGEQKAYRIMKGYETAEASFKEIRDREEKQIEGVTYSYLVASTEDVPEIPEDKEEDYTNGRLDIFRSYIEQLNGTGHEEMGAILANGEIATHAHNIYLQVAYDHGIFMGVLFVLVGIATFIRACAVYHKQKEKTAYAALPAVVTTAVAVAGLVEWIFHVSHPCGFVLMLVITPLVFKNEG